MKLLTLEARLTCKHITGVVQISAHQHFVRIAGQPVLVEPDPLSRPIKRCANLGATIKPCQFTTIAVETGYSDFIRIQNLRVCLDTLTGLTDGTPPGSVKYGVRSPGQSFVSEVK